MGEAIFYKITNRLFNWENKKLFVLHDFVFISREMPFKRLFLNNFVLNEKTISATLKIRYTVFEIKRNWLLQNFFF